MIEPKQAVSDGAKPKGSGVRSGVTTLYRFFDAEDRLLYVGITSRGPNRWRDHEGHRAWWSKVARSTTEHFDSRAEAMRAEYEAIRAEVPAHNTVHTGTRSQPSSPVYRRHGQGSVIYRPERDRWAAITPRNRKWFHFRTEAQARAFLEAYILASDPDVAAALVTALRDA